MKVITWRVYNKDGLEPCFDVEDISFGFFTNNGDEQYVTQTDDNKARFLEWLEENEINKAEQTAVYTFEFNEYNGTGYGDSLHATFEGEEIDFVNNGFIAKSKPGDWYQGDQFSSSIIQVGDVVEITVRNTMDNHYEVRWFFPEYNDSGEINHLSTRRPYWNEGELLACLNYQPGHYEFVYDSSLMKEGHLITDCFRLNGEYHPLYGICLDIGYWGGNETLSKWNAEVLMRDLKGGKTVTNVTVDLEAFKTAMGNTPGEYTFVMEPVEGIPGRRVIRSTLNPDRGMRYIHNPGTGRKWKNDAGSADEPKLSQWRFNGAIYTSEELESVFGIHVDAANITANSERYSTQLPYDEEAGVLISIQTTYTSNDPYDSFTIALKEEQVSAAVVGKDGDKVIIDVTETAPKLSDKRQHRMTYGLHDAMLGEGKILRDVASKKIYVNSEEELADLWEELPGTVAMLYGCGSAWQKNGQGDWMTLTNPTWV